MRKLCVALLLVLIAIKVAATLARGPVSIELDAAQYWRLSTAVLNGDFWLIGQRIAYRTPVYPWFLAAIRTITGPAALPTIVALQGALYVATLALAAGVAVRMTRLPLAAPWTLLAALPVISAIPFTAALLSETLFVFLLMLHLDAVLGYARFGTAGRAVWMGLTFALTLLTRPIVLWLWIAHLLFLVMIHWRAKRRPSWSNAGRSVVSWRQRIAHAAFAAAAAASLVAPWMMRNQLLFGEPFVTEFVGRNIWIVTFQDESGAGLDLPATPSGNQLRRRLAHVGVQEGWRHTWTVSQALVASGLSDPQADRLMKQVSLEAMRSDPKTVAYKAFRRVVNFWRAAATDLPAQMPESGNYFGQPTWQWQIPPVDVAIEYRWSQSVWLNTLLTAVLVTATLLLMAQRSTRPYGWWLLLIYGYFATVTGLLEIPAYRYRMILEPLIAGTLGAAAAVLLSWRRRPAKVLSSAIGDEPRRGTFRGGARR